MLLKCNQCKQLEDESPTCFYNRTKKDYNSPFFCKFCSRVIKLDSNPKLAKKKLKEHEEKLIRKRDLKSFVKKTNENEYFKLKVKENIELLKQKNAEYRKTESGKNAIQNAYIGRRDMILDSLVNIDAQEHAKIKEFYKNRPKGYEVDHIIPISKGGKHCIGNLQYLTGNENKQKSNKIDKFLIESLCEGQKVTLILLMRKFKMTIETARELLEGIWF